MPARSVWIWSSEAASFGLGWTGTRRSGQGREVRRIVASEEDRRLDRDLTEVFWYSIITTVRWVRWSGFLRASKRQSRAESTSSRRRVLPLQRISNHADLKAVAQNEGTFGQVDLTLMWKSLKKRRKDLCSKKRLGFSREARGSQGQLIIQLHGYQNQGVLVYFPSSKLCKGSEVSLMST